MISSFIIDFHFDFVNASVFKSNLFVCFGLSPVWGDMDKWQKSALNDGLDFSPKKAGGKNHLLVT
jgi:hypothetical protein